MKTKLLIGIPLCFAIIICIYLYTYKTHRDISSETADYVVSITELEKEFLSDGNQAQTKYQDKTIQLTASVTAVDSESMGIVLDYKVFAIFNDSVPKNISSGKIIKIKGRFLGYDELLGVFKIDQSSVAH